MGKFDNKTVFITGASAGLGAALAQAFASEGANLVLVARRLDRLEMLATQLRAQGCVVQVFRCDVTQQAGLTAVVAELDRMDICIDVVVANAGFGVVGRMQDLTLADYQRQFETNVFGVLRTTYALLEQLRRTRGRLVVIGSIAGHVAQPGGSAYAMSKFALRAWCESIRVELATEGIGVTLISPGLIDSDFRRVDNQNDFHADMMDPFPGWLRLSAASAAGKIVVATHRNQRERIITVHGKAIVLLQRHCPWLIRFLFKFGGQARQQPHSK